MGENPLNYYPIGDVTIITTEYCIVPGKFLHILCNLTEQKNVTSMTSLLTRMMDPWDKLKYDIVSSKIKNKWILYQKKKK